MKDPENVHVLLDHLNDRAVMIRMSSASSQDDTALKLPRIYIRIDINNINIHIRIQMRTDNASQGPRCD